MLDGYWARLLAARLRRRSALGTVGALGLGSALWAACGGQEGASDLKLDDSATARQPGTVWFAKNDWRLADETKEAVRGGIDRSSRNADFLSDFDPIPQEAANAGAIGDHVYQHFMARNRGPGIEPGSAAYVTPIPSLAEAWEISADGLTVTLTLRRGVKFQNIPPVNARVMDMDDWQSSHERFMQTSPYRANLGEALDKIESPDGRHFVWKLKFPFAPIFDRIYDDTFTYYILPKELNADPVIARSTPIGTSVKIFDKYHPALTVEWRKHPEYWGGNPFIERWHEPIIPEYANRYAQFIRDNITTFTPNARDVMILRKDAPSTVIVASALPETSATRIRFGRINPQGFPWKDERVRIAIRRSIDNKGIGAFLSNKAEFETAGIPVEMRPMTHVMQNPAYWLDPENGDLGSHSENYIYDLNAAKRLAVAAGYPDPIRLPYHVSGTGDIAEAETLVIDSLRKSGIFDVEVRQVAAAEYRTAINIDGRFDGVQSQSPAAGADNDYVAYRDYHSRGRPGQSQAFPDPKIDELAEGQRRAIDFEKRAAIFKEIQIYLAQKMYTVPGRHLFTTFSFRWPWLHNDSYGNRRPDLGLHLHWLDPNMPNRDKPV